MVGFEPTGTSTSCWRLCLICLHRLACSQLDSNQPLPGFSRALAPSQLHELGVPGGIRTHDVPFEILVYSQVQPSVSTSDTRRKMEDLHPRAYTPTPASNRDRHACPVHLPWRSLEESNPWPVSPHTCFQGSLTPWSADSVKACRYAVRPDRKVNSNKEIARTSARQRGPSVGLCERS